MCKGEETVCERLLGHPVEGSENSKEQPSFQKMVKNPFQELYSRNFDIPEGRTIYLSRHGESEFNLDDRIGACPWPGKWAVGAYGLVDDCGCCW